ncbi:MAG: P-loop NTPase [Candidatus Micrarchaeaceae archaeon]
MEEAQEEKKAFLHPSIFKVLEQRKRIKAKLSNIRYKVGIYSAKGGVGKTTVTINLAYSLKDMGYNVGILDADIDCPNVPLFLGIEMKNEEYPLNPFEKDGVKILSTAFFMNDQTKPIIWRGPLIGKMISEFLENAEWGSLDFLLIDLPPGTSDAPLSIIQLLDLFGFIIVTTPQKVARVNALRSAFMAKRLGVNLIGFVENMSRGEEVDSFEKDLGAPLLGRISENDSIKESTDSGKLAIENKKVQEEFISLCNSLLKELGISTNK